MRTTTLRLTPAQQSALECAGLEEPDSPGEQAVRVAWCGRQLTVTDVNRDALVRGLTELSNSESELAEHLPDEPVQRGMARRASWSLTYLAEKVRRTGEERR